MKFYILFFAFVISFQLNAQKEIKIVKIDNSNFPQIDLIIKGLKTTDTDKLEIFENKKKLKFITSDVPIKEIKKESRILFLINNTENESVKMFLLKELTKLKKTDLINIGIMTKTEKNKISVHYLSPEFSNKRNFFKVYLESKTINFPQQEDCKYQKEIQNDFFSKDSEFKNSGIIIIGDLENNNLNFCSDFKKNASIPIYILQTKALAKSTEDKIIEICMKSGGMYTQSKSNSDRKKILKRYTEDLSLDPINSESNFKKISFLTLNSSNETVITVSYGKISQNFNIQKPSAEIMSKKELYLTIFSSGLLLIILFLLFKYRKNKKGQNSDTGKSINMQPMKMTIPIEINVKGKGLNKTYFFEKHLIRIGRNSDNDIVIPDTTVSGNHAVINKEGKEFAIQDLGSTNGVLVNQKKVKKQILNTKDQIKLGGVVMFVRF